MENRSDRGMHWAVALLIAFAVRIAVMVISGIAIAALGISEYPEQAVNGVWAQFAFDLIANAVWIALTWKRYAACKSWSIYNIGWCGLLRVVWPLTLLWEMTNRNDPYAFGPFNTAAHLKLQLGLRLAMVIIMVLASYISECKYEDMENNEAWLKAEQEKDAARQIEKKD